MAFRTKDGTWRIHKRIDGKRITMRFPTQKLAERFEDELKYAKYAGLMPLGKLDTETPTFADFAPRWVEDHCKVRKAESQWREDESVIRLYLEPAFGSKPLGALKRSDLYTLQGKLAKIVSKKTGRVLGPKTVNNITGLARKILESAVDWEVIPSNPFANVDPLNVSGQRFDFWTPDERDRFLRFARQHNPEFTRVVQLACFTGLRHGEIAALQRGDLDFDRRLILVGRNYSYKLKKGWDRTKSGRFEPIPMNDAAREVLLESRLMKTTDRIFPLPLLDHAWAKLRKLCAKTGTRLIRFHDLRHTFASCLAMEGVDQYTIQRLMRHASSQMTQRYMHLSPSFLHRESSRLTLGTGMAPDDPGMPEELPQLRDTRGRFAT